LVRPTLLALCLLSSLAQAQTEREDDEGIDLTTPRVASSGRSYTYGGLIAPGSRALIAQLGWPGFTFAYRQGSTPEVDFGGAFTFNYSPDGMTQFVVPQIKLGGHVKFLLTQREKLSVQLRIAPELQFTFWSSYYVASYTALGLDVPLELTLGVDITEQLRAHLGFQSGPGFNVWTGFSTFAVFMVPVQAGGGFEYTATKELSIHFTTRMGPQFVVGRFGGTWFSMDLLLGMTYRI
jgi:hypothetical protein